MPNRIIETSAQAERAHRISWGAALALAAACRLVAHIPFAAAIAVISAMAVFSTALVAGPAIKFTEGSTWMLPDNASDVLWLEIHDIDGVGTKAVYHISVLSRRKIDPGWKLTHVVAHMAITAAALGRSVTPAAAHMGAAYPETYEDAYRVWLALREKKGTSPICVTTVSECAHLSGSP